MTEKIPSILIADDHSMIRMGLKLYLEFNLKVTDITETSSCNGLMKELVKKKFTHLILDIILSDGNSLEVIPNIIKVYPGIRILVFSMQPKDIYGTVLKQYGIEYYLSKTASEKEIIAYLEKFLHGESLHEKATEQHLQNPFVQLAPRELETLHYLLRGIGTKETADILNLKMSTVSTIKNRIYEKTNAANLKELLELATLYNVNY